MTMTQLRRALAILAAGAVSATAMVAVSTPTASATHSEPLVLTNFALGATGYSTQVSGGDLDVASGPTGFSYVACTRFANKHRENNTLQTNIPDDSNPLVQVGATTTRTFTDKKGGEVSANSVNRVTKATIGGADGLVLEGIKTRAKAFHNGGGYGKEGVVTFTSVTLAGVPVSVAAQREVIVVPGVATVKLATNSGKVTDRSAQAQVTAVRIELNASGSTVLIGRATARIDGGAVSGIMSGAVWGSQLRGLGGIANSGRTALQPLPCVGTDGQFLRRNVAGVGIGDITDLGAVESSVRGDQDSSGAYAQGISTIARAGFLERDLVIKGIEARGYVKRRSDGSYVRNAKGTSTLSITFQGNPVVIAPGETVQVGNFAKVTTRVVDLIPNGIRVTAVQVQLLSGSGAGSTLDLGNVQLRVRRG
ncbi:MAG TPA: choice-of-anchor P family protein [Nocardioidaceae bacterium]|nr:choice-of-anchor P family protein [Nocardioidaceae bacterium]